MTKLYHDKGWPTDVEVAYPIINPLPNPNGDSRLVNPVIGRNHRTRKPIYPGQKGFEDQQHDVSMVRNDVEANKWPEWFLRKYHPKTKGYDFGAMPKPLTGKMARLSTRNPKACANIVHMDAVEDLFNVLNDWLRKEGAMLKKPATEGGHKDFLGRVVYPLETYARYMKSAMRKAFEAKYYWGLRRPEQTISDEVGINPLKTTAYKEGCPCHPSYPAGHGANAGATYKAITKIWDLTEEQRRTVSLSCYYWAQFRTFAGVHYSQDNTAGLKLGGWKP